MKTHLKLLFITGVFLLSCFVSASQLTAANGTVKRFENFPSVYLNAGNIDVWLPNGYDVDKKYAVLYMHNGPMLFDSATTPKRQKKDADETIGKLLAENKIQDCIVVGIWNTNLLRAEYSPKTSLEYSYDTKKAEVLNTTSGANKQSFLYNGPISDKYLKFIVLELKPFIDSTYSTLKDPANTFLAESSNGGLLSMYTIFEYPRTFGEATCISSLWPATFKMADNPAAIPCLKYLNDNIPLAQNHKIYFDYGTENLDPNYKPNQQQAALILKLKDYSAVNWITKTFAGASHNERAWNKRFYISLKFLFGK